MRYEIIGLEYGIMVIWFLSERLAKLLLMFMVMNTAYTYILLSSTVGLPAWCGTTRIYEPNISLHDIRAACLVVVEHLD